MIGGCILSASYPHEADLYLKVRTKKPSGQIDYKWQFNKTIICLVSPYLSRSFRLQGITETFGEEYDKFSYLKFLAGEQVGTDQQVTNVRDRRTQAVIYKEIELKTAPPTWYNLSGGTPILDPFGTVVQFEHLLSRAETQGEVHV